MVSVVLNELFLMPSILFPAKTEAEGATISFASKPTAAAAPAIATPAKNLRRFKYRLFGVISEERMSPAFLISIGTPPGSTRLCPRADVRRALLSIFSPMGRPERGKVTNNAILVGICEMPETSLPEHFPDLSRKVLQSKGL